ncbi:hypothetical protein [Parendozoicomonas sp. Alg238-R29]|uniref:hypothetical protein n=1 Tax=Parendozoicomonas sp. Alg238-R29 TaxID=2993446 RepID=UPI00248DA01B|nr:hypothetical protein [Parendozoicomonas sp. Alg238-R29]
MAFRIAMNADKNIDGSSETGGLDVSNVRGRSQLGIELSIALRVALKAWPMAVT